MLNKRSENKSYISMLLPCAILLFTLCVVPIIALFYYSFLSYDLSDPLGTKFIGIDNYIDVFKDKYFFNSIWVTLLVLAGILIFQVPISLFIMEMASLVSDKLSGFIKVIFIPPMIVPPIAAAIIWRIMFHPSSGVINYFLGFIGLGDIEWLSNPGTALLSIVLVDTWQFVPFLALILMAGRSAIPKQIYEASEIDGANKIQSFWKITLPLILPSLGVGIVFRIIDGIRIFPTIHLMTSGGPGHATETINYYTYRMAFDYSNIGYSSTLGIFLVIFSVILTWVVLRVFRIHGKE